MKQHLQRLGVCALGVVSLTASLVLFGVSQADPAVLPAWVSEATADVPLTATPAPPTGTVALPVRLEIPAIGVSTPLSKLGLTPSGALEVPAPGPLYDLAAWYRGSPRPGAVGPSVISGHIDSASDGPSVFFHLRALRAGDVAVITGADGTRQQFVVDEVHSYAKDRFPTALVYGDTAGPELRLITCGGAFDRRSGHYLDNTVVSAHLIARNRTPYPVVVQASTASS